MKSFTNMFADLLNDVRPGRSSSSTSSSSAAAAQQARGGRSTTGSRSASTAWESFDEPSSSSSSSGFTAPTPATQHPGFPAPIRGVASAQDGVHPLTREWADRIGNRAVRDAFLEHPIGDYTESHKLNVWTGRWNTNGKRPPPNLDISQWLDVDASQPDIVVVGFQEIVPLTPGKVLAVEDEKATKEWEAIIERALHKGDSSSPGPPHASSSGGRGDSAGGWASFDDAAGGAWASFDAAGNQRRGEPEVQDGETKIEPNSSTRRFTRLACKQLVGVYITVWVTQEAAAHVRDVRVATVSTGFNLGVGALQVATLGNKGGAAVWMRMYNTPALFVCSHLSAGSKPEDASKRSQDYHDIVSKLSFPAPQMASSDGTAERAASVKDAFASVWIGDLNYRLNLPDETVRSAIQTGGAGVQTLLSADQLVLEQAAGRAFVGWHEAPVTFLPTYKYRPGTNQFSGGGDADDEDDGSDPAGDAIKVSKKEEKKKRTPAWCDRILWRGWDITQLSYDRSELTQSDHKPVRSKFQIVARELQPERLQAVLLEHRRRLDFQEMASQPRCTLENPTVDVGDLRYGEPVTRTFRLVNVGDVPASWRFVPPTGGAPGDAARVSPGWITLTPKAGTLLPGAEVTIEATMLVVGGGVAGPAAVAGTLRGVGGDDDNKGASAATNAGPDGVTKKSNNGMDAASVSSSASTVAEAARIAAARAVNRGLLKAVESGGVAFVSEEERRRAGSASSLNASRRGSALDLTSLGNLSASGNSSGWNLDDEPGVPIDGILVLHLENGRDFFLTVAGTYRHSVFGKTLESLRSAAFPPGVPEPIRALADSLFDSRSPSALRPPARATLDEMSAVREVLERSHVSGATADVSGIEPRVVGAALLALFASAPTPLLATPRGCARSIDASMKAWSSAAVAAASAAKRSGTSWTLASPGIANLLPSAADAEELVRSSGGSPAVRATFAHVCALLRSLFGADVVGNSNSLVGNSLDSLGTAGGGKKNCDVARSIAQFAEVWFPRDDGADVGTKMGRVAFIGAACGCDLNFLDGFDPTSVAYDVEKGTGMGIVAGGIGNGVLGAGAATQDAGFTPAPGPASSGFEAAAAAASGFVSGTGNLIDI